MEEIIKVKNLTKSYGNITAVNHLSLSVPRGTVFGLLGANGAGKSTTIDCILGAQKADCGTVSILGMNPLSERKKLFEKVGVQFQEANYQNNITVKELCRVTAALYRDALDPAVLLDQFGIADKSKSPVSKLSGGQRQRLFVALALIPQPEIVFLDELTTGLDAKARRDVWKILKNMKAGGMTILLTSHFMDEVEVLCDRICVLKKGEMIFTGTVTEAVQASPYEKWEDTYLWMTEEESEVCTPAQRADRRNVERKAFSTIEFKSAKAG